MENDLRRLLNEFESAIVRAEKEGRGHYSDPDFDFPQFISYVRANYHHI